MLKRLRFSLIFVLISIPVLMFSGSVLSAQENMILYAAPDGLATNTGTAPNSPLTLKKALEVAPVGATINLLGGTYRVGESVRRQVTLQPYNGEAVALKGSIIVPDAEWAAEGALWVKTGWTYQFPPPESQDPEKYVDPAYPMANHRDQVYINGEGLEQVGSLAEVSAGKFYVDYDGDKLYVGSNPLGKTVEATAFNRGIGIFGSEKSGTVVRGLHFSHYADNAAQIGESNGQQAANVVIENNVFTWNGVAGLYVGGVDNVVRGNIFSYNGRKGMGGNGLRMLIEGNTFSYNNVERFKTNWDAAGIKVTRAHDIVFRHNHVHDNQATGFWMDIGTDNATVVHNIARNNKSIGIFFEISTGAIIAGNVSVGNGSGIQISNSSNALIYNNTLVANRTNLKVGESNRQAAPWENGGTYQTEGLKVVNNLFVDGEGANEPKAMIDTWMHDHKDCATVTPMFQKFDYNGYYRANPAQPENLVRWVQQPSKCYHIFATIDVMRADAQIELHGLELSGANPLFVDAGAGNYHLRADSPALGAGEPLPTDVAAALGWRTDVAVDLGAKQYTGLLTNGSFESGAITTDKLPAAWKVKGLAKRVCNKLDRPNKPDKFVAQHLQCAVKLKSAGKLTQKLDTGGLLVGDVLRLDGFASGKNAGVGGELRLKIKYQDDTKDRLSIALPTGDFTYQPVSGTIQLKALPQKLKVQAVYKGTGGKLTLDVLSSPLLRSRFARSQVFVLAPSVVKLPLAS